MEKISASFRDPSATVFRIGDRIIRGINKSGEEKFKLLTSSKILSESIVRGFLIETKVLDDSLIKKNLDCNFLLEHKNIPYISYPYEWNFFQLKDAAIHHLNFNIFLIENNFELIDASSYNIQFIGNKPVFIDVFSIDKYTEGSNWTAHNQFCQQFLNPLLITSLKGIAHNNWYRGNLEGISSEEICKILSFFQKINPTIFLNLVLPTYFERKNRSKKIDDLKLLQNKKGKFNKNSYLWMLKNLKSFILKLKRPEEKSFWKNYDNDNTYDQNQTEIKKKIVEEFIKKHNPEILCDLGCNTGEFSEISLNTGAKSVIGFDYDQGALVKSLNRSKEKKLNFLPLYLDAANPSSNIGWNQSERFGFLERCKFDALIALAFEHHLAIAKNIPLIELIDWFLDIAPKGLIEFVPKEDDTIKIMLNFRKDIFIDYTEDNFKEILSKKAKIIKINEIENSKRKIYEYEKIS